MDQRATRTWRWFRWACLPLALVVFFGVFDIGFKVTNGAGASGEGWLVVLGGVLAFAVVLAAAAALRLPLRHVAARLALSVLALVLVSIVVWAVFVTLTMSACAASGLAPASC
jgi:hypothetical protein